MQSEHEKADLTGVELFDGPGCCPICEDPSKGGHICFDCANAIPGKTVTIEERHPIFGGGGHNLSMADILRLRKVILDEDSKRKGL